MKKIRENTLLPTTIFIILLTAGFALGPYHGFTSWLLIGISIAVSFLWLNVIIVRNASLKFDTDSEKINLLVRELSQKPNVIQSICRKTQHKVVKKFFEKNKITRLSEIQHYFSRLNIEKNNLLRLDVLSALVSSTFLLTGTTLQLIGTTMAGDDSANKNIYFKIGGGILTGSFMVGSFSHLFFFGRITNHFKETSNYVKEALKTEKFDHQTRLVGSEILGLSNSMSTIVTVNTLECPRTRHNLVNSASLNQQGLFQSAPRLVNFTKPPLNSIRSSSIYNSMK